MNKRSKRKLLVVMVVFGVAIATVLILSALEENLNAFYSPSEVVAGEAPDNRKFRVGGLVVAGTVNRSEGSLLVEFDLTDNDKVITIEYSGILPDLFREGQGIVALGKMQDGKFIASQVLAQHDETYMPPEVDHALKAANKDRYNTATQL